MGGVAIVTSAVLVAGSGGYGYHRDELYFLRAGDELAFGYVDQPPLTPLLARVASDVFGDSLVGLRLASAVAAGLVVLCTGSPVGVVAGLGLQNKTLVAAGRPARSTATAPS